MSIYENINELSKLAKECEKKEKEINKHPILDCAEYHVEDEEKGYFEYKIYDEKQSKVRVPDFMIVMLAKMLNWMFHRNYVHTITGAFAGHWGNNMDVFVKTDDYSRQLSPWDNPCEDVKNHQLDLGKLIEKYSDDENMINLRQIFQKQAALKENPTEHDWFLCSLTAQNRYDMGINMGVTEEQAVKGALKIWERGPALTKNMMFLPDNFKNGKSKGSKLKSGENYVTTIENGKVMNTQRGKWISVSEDYLFSDLRFDEEHKNKTPEREWDNIGIKTGLVRWDLEGLQQNLYYAGLKNYLDLNRTTQMGCQSGLFNCDICFNEHFVEPLVLIFNMDEDQEQLFRNELYKNIGHCEHSSGVWEEDDDV